MTTSYDTPSGAHASAASTPPAQASLNCGVVGNCAFSALIDQKGQVVWSCLPLLR